jgi:hypothetical protein
MSFVSFVSTVSFPAKRIALFHTSPAVNPATVDRYFQQGWYVALVSNESDWNRSTAPKERIQYLLDRMYAVNGWKPHYLVSTNTTADLPGRTLYDVLLFSLQMTAEQVEEVLVVTDCDTGVQFASNIDAKVLVV